VAGVGGRDQGVCYVCAGAVAVHISSCAVAVAVAVDQF
jgi:hypothetical protein